MPLPLEGVLALDLSAFYAGPYCTMLLADMGAEVVKIEQPMEGDPYRNTSAGGLFVYLNRNKKGLTLDLKTQKGKEVFYKLVKKADVLVENFRRGVTERLGVDYGTISALNPRIVYCSISGFGETGPYCDRPAYDSIGMSLSGFLSLLTDPNSPRPLGGSMTDQLSGMYALQGILAALFSAQRTGKGQRVTTSLLEAATCFIGGQVVRNMVTGKVPNWDTFIHASQCYALKAQDGRSLMMHFSSVNKFWENLGEIHGFEEIVKDPRFQNIAGRRENYSTISELLQKVVSTRPQEHWLKELASHGIPGASLNSIDQAIKDPQILHLGIVKDVAQAKSGSIKLVRSPITFSEMPSPAMHPQPALGEHNNSILERLGYTQNEINELKANKVI